MHIFWENSGHKSILFAISITFILSLFILFFNACNTPETKKQKSDKDSTQIQIQPGDTSLNKKNNLKEEEIYHSSKTVLAKI